MLLLSHCCILALCTICTKCNNVKMIAWNFQIKLEIAKKKTDVEKKWFLMFLLFHRKKLYTSTTTNNFLKVSDKASFKRSYDWYKCIGWKNYCVQALNQRLIWTAQIEELAFFCKRTVKSYVFCQFFVVFSLLRNFLCRSSSYSKTCYLIFFWESFLS